MTSDEYKSVVLQAKEHILAGDIFQIVLSQCFERRTFADPFEIYRALRVVNPSPYMTYLQNTVVNQPLAGTVRRGRTPDEDTQLEKMLLGDEKQCAEHIMLVDVSYFFLLQQQSIDNLEPLWLPFGS
ncbi:putative anthranilate synthase [Helianthus annuus]|uniref:Anthranilate synthase n=1 Tax=Helianthus annuus TaxID=4232 RepID=A0A9K3H5V5_HELAN|nr:putative anthranilate synthase [Helianthus annuus]KAJ0839700.1 putative anthranilate synthase [Helianthus annuus]